MIDFPIFDHICYIETYTVVALIFYVNSLQNDRFFFSHLPIQTPPLSIATRNLCNCRVNSRCQKHKNETIPNALTRCQSNLLSDQESHKHLPEFVPLIINLDSLLGDSLENLGLYSYYSNIIPP